MHTQGHAFLKASTELSRAFLHSKTHFTFALNPFTCTQGYAFLEASTELSEACATAMLPLPDKKARKNSKAALQQEEEVAAIEGAKARAAAASRACSQV